MSKPESYVRFKKEQEDWLLRRKQPSPNHAYTFEDMYYVQIKGERLSIIIAILVPIMFAIGLHLGASMK